MQNGGTEDAPRGGGPSLKSSVLSTSTTTAEYVVTAVSGIDSG
jgi:hypothetical protein